MIVELAHKFKLRQYQLEAWQAFFVQGYKRLVTVWHRRAGKDAMALNIIIAASQLRVGVYYYIFPELKQARRNVWEAINKQGKKFLDYFPPQLIKRIDNSEMTIEFHNGSLFRLCGGDRYNVLMGSNPVGVVFSEYSLMNPMAWDFIRPILAENGGWALFNYTPRGGNHGLEMAEMAQKNPNWFYQLLTVNDTLDHNDKPVLSKAVVDEERASGMSDDMIDQEYYCSFKAAVRGAYFSTQLRQAEASGRICEFPIDNSIAVSTYWDLGLNDVTAIWFIQTFRNEARAIWYYENSGEGIGHYVNYINKFRDERGIVYAKHYWPHDGGVRNYGEDAKKRSEIARELGMPVIIVPRTQDKQDSIESARSVFSKVYFHRSNCKQGLACLTEYHKKYNEDSRAFSEHPEHNWASNGADAFQTFSMSWKGQMREFQEQFKAQDFREWSAHG